MTEDCLTENKPSRLRRQKKPTCNYGKTNESLTSEVARVPAIFLRKQERSYRYRQCQLFVSECDLNNVWFHQHGTICSIYHIAIDL